MPEFARYRLYWDDAQPVYGHHPFDGDQAHNVVAKVAEAFADDARARIPSYLLDPRVGEGDTGIQVSPFRYSASGKHGWMSLTAFGDEAVDALRSDGHRIGRALGKVVGRPLREEWQTGQIDVRHSTRVHRYNVWRWAFERTETFLHPDLWAPGGVLAEDAVTRLGTRALESLRRQARLVGVEWPDDCVLRVISYSPPSAYTRKRFQHAKFLRQASFGTDLALSGPWNIGSWVLCGFGAISAERSA